MVDDGVFPAIHRRHIAAITPLVGPAMLLSVALQGALVLRTPRGVPVGLAGATFGASLAVLAWTVFVQAPLHARLAAGEERSELAALLCKKEPPRAIAVTLQVMGNLAMAALS